MIGREKRMLLRHYLQEGLSKSEISRRLDMSRDTIHRLIRTGQLDRDLDAEPARYTRRPPVPTKLDPYRAMIVARLEAYPRLSSVRLLGEVQAAGYTGGYTQVKEFARTVRPGKAPEPVVRFETPAGLVTHRRLSDFRPPDLSDFRPALTRPRGSRSERALRADGRILPARSKDRRLRGLGFRASETRSRSRGLADEARAGRG